MTCGLCQSSVCKGCVEVLQAEAFSFMKERPQELIHNHYCSVCYATKVQPAIRSYNEIMKQAKEVFIIDKPRRQPLPILKRSAETLLVEDCLDREETVLRLAFMAAERGFNAVIKAKVVYRKVRNAGYQKMLWQGTGFPAVLQGDKLAKQD
jgi:hypothetical protein